MYGFRLKIKRLSIFYVANTKANLPFINYFFDNIYTYKLHIFINRNKHYEINNNHGNFKRHPISIWLWEQTRQ
ncbi:hypothetical protein D3C87_204710 [compost metagenome]